MSISVNPMATSNAAGSFSVQSDGYIQGVALDDPSIRNQLVNGVLASTETLPMVGGYPLFELMHAATNNGALGGSVGRATVATGILGWSVVNQAHAWVTTPQSPCPSAGVGQTIPLYRNGSRARIAVPIDATVGAALLGATISPSGLYWDVALLQINTTAAANIALTGIKVIDVQIGNSKIAVYDAVNNVFTYNASGSVAIIEI